MVYATSIQRQLPHFVPGSSVHDDSEEAWEHRAFPNQDGNLRICRQAFQYLLPRNRQLMRCVFEVRRDGFTQLPLPVVKDEGTYSGLLLENLISSL